MINQKSLNAIQDASFGPYFCLPLYENYCFSRLPHTIQFLLTGCPSEFILPQDVFPSSEAIPYKRVIHILLDGFGWRFLNEYLDESPFIKRFQRQGVISKITSQFPSTTIAHMTCLHTGLTVAQHGLYEFYHYEPLVDTLIAPLLFSYANDDRRDTLLSVLHPNKLYPDRTIYETLSQLGISSTLFYPEEYALSAYSQTTGAGSRIIPYKSFHQALNLLAGMCSESSGYFYLYVDEIDMISHRSGPSSSRVRKSIQYHLDLLEKFFNKHSILHDSKTAIILTADHGQTSIDPSHTVYINQLHPQLEKWTKKNRLGDPILPAGTCRDLFLHIEDNMLANAQEILTTSLKGIAEVYLTQELVDIHLFGSQPPSPRLLERIGNLVILPYADQSVYWLEPNQPEISFRGHHGGLTRDEMETIFLMM